jgi:hypothetical protein
MVRLGPHKQVFEAHRGFFLKADYSDVGVSAPSQASVARSLTETAFGRPARYFVSAIPHAKNLLEFDQPEHCYSPVSSKEKTCALGKVNDEGSWSLRTQHFHRDKSQVGASRAITLKAACRSVRVTIASIKVLRTGRAA